MQIHDYKKYIALLGGVVLIAAFVLVSALYSNSDNDAYLRVFRDYRYHDNDHWVWWDDFGETSYEEAAHIVATHIENVRGESVEGLVALVSYDGVGGWWSVRISVSPEAVANSEAMYMGWVSTRDGHLYTVQQWNHQGTSGHDILTLGYAVDEMVNSGNVFRMVYFRADELAAPKINIEMTDIKAPAQDGRLNLLCAHTNVVKSVSVLVPRTVENVLWLTYNFFPKNVMPDRQGDTAIFFRGESTRIYVGVH